MKMKVPMSKVKLSRSKIKAIVLVCIVVLVGFDQIIKYVVDLYLKPIGSVNVIPRVLSFTYLENDGALLPNLVRNP